jgi:3-dehydrosphinganine reductase
MEINFFGSVNITRAILPDMKLTSNGGGLVFVSSLARLVGLYGFTAYSASKFAVRGFAEALAMGNINIDYVY